jgi:hypothetical protein
MAHQPTGELERNKKKGTKGRAISGPQPIRRMPTVSEGGTNPIDMGDVTSPGGGAQALLFETTRGRVSGYSVTSVGLIIHLDCSAISRLSVSVDADEPHFRSAVSMAMVALNNRIAPSTTTGIDQHYLWVRMEKTSKGSTIRRAAGVALSHSNDSDPFDHEGWSFAPMA